MHLLTKAQKTHYEYNYLLLLSFIFVSLMLYTFMDKFNYIQLTPKSVVPKKVEYKKVSITIKSATIVKQKPIVKEIVKPKAIVKPKPVIKKVIKPKPIKKAIKTISIPKPIKKIQKSKPIVKEIIKPVEVVKKVEPKPIVKEVVKPTPVITKEIVKEPVVVTPVFDAKLKESFIAGLYAQLNALKKYPKMAKRRKLEGVAHIKFTLAKNGNITNVFLDKSSGHKLLDKAALKILNAISTYKAIPDEVSLKALHLKIPIKYSRG